MTNNSVLEDCQVGCASTNVNHYYTALHLVLSKYSVSGSQRFKNYTLELKTGPVNTLLYVLDSSHTTYNTMLVSFQPWTSPTDSIPCSLLIIHTLLLRS